MTPRPTKALRGLLDAYRQADYAAAAAFLEIRQQAPHLSAPAVLDSAQRIVFAPDFRQHLARRP